ncbi:MAG: hypothetical protein H3Z53_01070, partial [archaeon]|nr:hypothetical protein [archaeon]MCP8312954.1 hypothetical protein [archaeon]
RVLQVQVEEVKELDGYESFMRIVKVVEHVRSLAENLPLSNAIAKAQITYKDYPKVVSVIAEAASSNRLIRLEEKAGTEAKYTNVELGFELGMMFY